MQTRVIRVEGMSCGHCEASLREGVAALAGVERVEASAARGEAIVHYAPHAEPDWAAVRAAIEEAGFEPQAGAD